MPRQLLICVLLAAFTLPLSAGREAAEIYAGALPTASGSGRVVTLILYPDGSCLLIEKHLDRDPPGGFTSAGIWEEGPGPAERTVRLAGPDGTTREMRFEASKGDLQYIGTEFGAVGLHLKRAAGLDLVPEPSPPPLPPEVAAEGPLRTVLVLSGGGARGAAHAGVLKVLEEMRIPVDAVVGTSMGAIMGGLYASGLSPEEVEAEIRVVNWVDLFDDSPPRKDLSFRRKQDDHLPLFDIEVGVGKRGLVFPSGMIAGQKISFILRKMTLHTAAIEDFDDLPIPYRAVAMDVETGEAVVMGSGDLAQAMRASMAFPGMFTPVVMDGRVLVDGGPIQNLPVQTALDLGAERIIAIDISSPLSSLKKDASSFKIMRRTFSVLSRQVLQEQLAMLREQDLLITPDLGDISFMSFDRLEDAAAIGEQAARMHEEALRRFSVSEEEYAAWFARHRRTHLLAAGKIVVDEIEVRGLNRVDPRQIEGRIHSRAGEPLDLETLQKDLIAIYRIGEFERVQFRLVREGDLNRLLIQADEKSWGPGYLRVGLGLEANFSGQGNFAMVGLYRRTQINRLGAEWKNIISIGDRDGVFTEFYQPLSYSGVWFVAPRLEFFRDQYRLSTSSGERVEADSKVRFAQLDFGAQFHTYGEARLGARWGRIDADIKPGDTSFDARIGEGIFELAFDKMDNANFPRQGTYAELFATLSREDLGADDEFDRLFARYTQAGSFGKSTVIGQLRLGTDMNSDLPFYRQFQLGGFLNLSGLERGALQGDRLAYANIGYYNKVHRLKSLFGEGIYVGATLEAGNIWNHGEDVRFDDLMLAGTVWAGADTMFGPLYVGYGLAEGGHDSFYIFLGKVFGRTQRPR